MTLSMSDLDFHVELPDLPRSIPVPRLEVIEFRQRQRAIEYFAERLGLRDLRTAQTRDSVAMASESGEIEYFPASGAIWARDATAGTEFDDELRDWGRLERPDREDGDLARLDGRRAGAVVHAAVEAIEEAGLREETHGEPVLSVEQVARLDEHGEITASGLGSATVTMGFAVEGTPVLGAGAKTQVFLDPAGEGVRITGAFHCWRRIAGMETVEMEGIKESLTVGVLRDPELMLYHEKGAHIEVTALRFGYLALPAMVLQSTLFPAFAVEGIVRQRDDRLGYFEFARFHHAVAPERYQKAGLFDDYLGVML